MAELRLELRGDDQIWLSGEGDRADWPGLYARLCDPHVREGRIAHYVEVPADDGEQLELWYALGFGRQQVYASRAIGAVPYAGPVQIRPGELADVDWFGELLLEHLRGAPTWATLPRTPEENRAAWEEFLAEPQTTCFVGELEGRAIAYLALYDNGEPGTIELDLAATRPEARGRGAMRALTAAAFAWAAERGYERCDADWRSTNLEADGSWRRLGFRPTRYRLHRLVGR